MEEKKYIITREQLIDLTTVLAGRSGEVISAADAKKSDPFKYARPATDTEMVRGLYDEEKLMGNIPGVDVLVSIIQSAGIKRELIIEKITPRDKLYDSFCFLPF